MERGKYFIGLLPHYCGQSRNAEVKRKGRGIFSSTIPTDCLEVRLAVHPGG